MDFDKAELLLYEAVEKMPPFSRKTLVFVSPAGIPKRTLVHRLVDSNHDMFGRPVPRKLRIILISTFWYILRENKNFTLSCSYKSTSKRL